MRDYKLKLRFNEIEIQIFFLQKSAQTSGVLPVFTFNRRDYSFTFAMLKSDWDSLPKESTVQLVIGGNTKNDAPSWSREMRLKEICVVEKVEDAPRRVEISQPRHDNVT